MKKQTVTLSKTIKLPIPGIQYSNQSVFAEIVFEAKGFDKEKAWQELNELMWLGQREEKEEKKDPNWIEDIGNPVAK